MVAKKPAKTQAQRRAERQKAIELRFAALYITNGRNGTAAYRVIYPRAQPASASVQASRLLVKTTVQDEIARLTAEAWKREHMTAEELLARSARMSRMDIRDFYWRPGELNRAGEVTVEGQRKPLSELTDAQAECVKGFKYDARGRMVQEHWDKPEQMRNLMQNHKLLTEKLDIHMTTPLDKLIEGSYGENKPEQQ